MAFEYVFSWDPTKGAANRAKHGVAFELATTVFRDPLALTIPDTSYSSEEGHRWITLGQTATGELIVLVHTFDEVDGDGARVRLISARRATRSERQQYENG